MLAGELPEPPEPVARSLRIACRRGHRRQTEHPVPQVLGEPRRLDTPLEPSPARFTCTSAGISSLSAAEWESTEWTSFADPVQHLHLVRLEPPDEVPPEASP